MANLFVEAVFLLSRGVEVAPANRHDMKLVADTLASMMCARPLNGKASYFCLDLGYDYDQVRSIVRIAGLDPVILSRRDENKARSSAARKPGVG